MGDRLRKLALIVRGKKADIEEIICSLLPLMSHRYSRPDHIRNRQVPLPSNEAVNKHLQTLLSPLVYSQQAYTS
jgi:hypothetical protein